METNKKKCSGHINKISAYPKGTLQGEHKKSKKNHFERVPPTGDGKTLRVFKIANNAKYHIRLFFFLNKYHICHFLSGNTAVAAVYRGGTLRLVLFEKYLLPRKKPRARAHFVRADQGNKMQSLVRFFTG